MTNQLPPLRQGKVYALRIYPGGRKELRQYAPAECMSTQDARQALREHRIAIVKLDNVTPDMLQGPQP